MTRRPGFGHRDVAELDEAARDPIRGRMYVAVIGIDRYGAWTPLHNAVRDARGALNAFIRLGFEPFGAPLLDEAATGTALHHLVSDELRRLGEDDSLVLFFAGHGHTLRPAFSDDRGGRRGYLIPSDAEALGGRISTWLPLDSWLTDVTRLPPRHILVILDACHSGIALDPATLWRGESCRLSEPIMRLNARRSRRVITSALDNELAMDGGPIAGHSLFTGCLIEALDGGVFARFQRPIATGSEIWSHVRDRVFAFSALKNAKQTPEFGRLDFDDHGELIVEQPEPEPERAASTPKRKRRTSPVAVPAVEPSAPGRRSTELDAAFAALDRHDAERMRGASVLSVLAGEPAAVLTGWATWAARRGHLTLITEGANLDATVRDLLAQAPWLRSLPAARARLAAAAQIPVDEVDAALDARSALERTVWIDDVAGMDPHAQVSGWLLSALRAPSAWVPDLSTAPVQCGELLSILCDLASPIAVLMHHAEPHAGWLEGAIRTAAALVTFLPRHSVAVGAPGKLVTSVLRSRDSAALSMARQGVVPIASATPPSGGRARSRAEQTLYDALARDPRTTGRFALNVAVPVGDLGTVEVDLAAKPARLAVELDGWFHFRDPQGYRRDRAKDVLLQRAGFFVMRFLAEDVEDRLALIVDEIAIGLGGRRAASLSGDPS
ncbi:MAG TPA: caspase family protein [Kofleriaceae bacterium]